MHLSGMGLLRVFYAGIYIYSDECWSPFQIPILVQLQEEKLIWGGMDKDERKK